VDLVDLDTTNRGGREPHAPTVAPADAKRPHRGQDPNKSRSHLVEELKPGVVEAPQEHLDSHFSTPAFIKELASALNIPQQRGKLGNQP